MIHPNTKLCYINDEMGYGVVATAFIPKGTIIWVKDDLDQTFSPERVRTFHPSIQEYLESYTFTNRHGEKVFCWDDAKYMNHSFNHSCCATAYDFEIAIKDIAEGDELTDDYGYFNVKEAFYPKDEGTARKVVYPDDLLHLYKQWDALILENAPHALKVPQPLLHLIPPGIWNGFSNDIQNSTLRSILDCYYPHNE
jgi:hypothetical protein